MSQIDEAERIAKILMSVNGDAKQELFVGRRECPCTGLPHESGDTNNDYEAACV
jgi:hypothetical protein